VFLIATVCAGKRMKEYLVVAIVVAIAIVVVIVGAAFLVLKRIRTRKAQAAPTSHQLAREYMFSSMLLRYVRICSGGASRKKLGGPS
jgi:hypothetical protein